ncbi:MAG: carboxypeptidase regulatory-like domain-containing protein [Planctomycetes bacterium]|nr:carboxypeptidase regulatory-like domain-containing protein [Planctomycetota bacterium]
MSTTHPDEPRRARAGAGPGVLVAVVLVLGALGAAAFWLAGGDASDESARLERGADGASLPGMALELPGPRASESLEDEVSAPARAAAEAAERESAAAEIELREGALSGRVVALDGGPLPDGLAVHLRWTRPSPRLRTISLGTARDETFPDEAEVFSQGPNDRDSLRARDARLALVTRTPVASDGSFRIAKVPRMACWVQVEHATWWAPDPPRIAGLPPKVTLPEEIPPPTDGVERVDDALPRDAATDETWSPVEVTVAITRGAALEGFVHDDDGRPVSGSRLTISVPMDPFTFLEGQGKGLSADFARSDSEGRFRLGPLPSDVAFKLAAESTGDVQGAVASVDALQPDEVREVDLLLPLGAGVSGRVIDEDETPLADADVRLVATDVSAMSFGNDARPPEIERTSDASGGFEFRGVAAGGYRLIVAARDRVPSIGESFELAPGQRLSDVELRVRRGLSVSGRVVDARGEPVPEAEVMAALPPSMMDVRANMDRTYRHWKDVDGDGRFVLSGYDEGKLKVRARAPGRVSASLEADAGAEDLLLTLGDTTSIAGIAMDLDTGDPLTSYTLACYAGDGSFSMADMFELQDRLEASRPPLHVRHDEGRFLLDGLQPGPYTLLLTAEGHARVVRSGLRAEAGKATTGVILMVPLEGRITGTVVDGRTGAPLGGALVTTGGTDMMSTYKELFSGTPPRATTDDDGRFELSGLSEDPVTLTVRHEGHVDETLPDTFVRSGQTLDVGLVRLSGGARLYGRIVDGRGQPAHDVTVLAADATGRTMKRASSDSDGRWEVLGLEPGSYRVTRMDFTVDVGDFDAGDYMEKLVTKSVTVAADEDLEVDLSRDDAPGTTLRGLVSSSDGPQAKALVFAVLQDGGADVRMATADDDGRYELSGLRPGEYLLQVMPDMSDFTAGSQPSAPVSDVVDVLDMAVQVHDLHVPGGVLEVLLSDESAHGVDGVRVIVERTDAGRTASSFLERTGNRVGEAFSKDGGHTRFGHLSTGTYDVAVGGRNLLGVGDTGWAFQRVGGVRVTDGKPATTLRVTLRPGAGIEGLVTDARGKPVAGAPVWVRDEIAGRWLSVLSETSTDHAGMFHVDGLEPGPYSLALGGTSHAFTRVPALNVSRGHVARADVTLPDGVEVFVDPGPYSLHELSAQVADSLGRIPLDLSSMDSLLGQLAQGGRLRVGRVASGSYDLTVKAGDSVVRSGTVTVRLADDPLTITLEKP